MQAVKPIAWHFALLLGALSASWPAAALKINGSTTVNLPVAEAAEVLRAEQGMQIEVDTQGGSSGGISALGEGLVQIGMSSKPLTDMDRAKYPQVRFKAIHVGEDAVTLVVSRDVWEGGVRALSQEEVRDIYEGRITHWTQLGGPDRRIVFFNKEPGRGTWEVFAHWLYGDAKRALQVSFLEVGGNEETRTKVASTRGALSQLSAAWADAERVFALGIRHRDGRVVEPTPQHIATHAYPMSRPLFLLTDGEPQGEVKTFVDFMLSERGQALVRKHGFLRLKDLKR
jgi:phosphate transport system substrate-binding protein